MKKTNIILIALVVLLVVVTIVASLNMIAMAQIKKITVGMTFDEVEDVLGEYDAITGSGFAIYEWRLANGDMLWIWFTESKGEACVSSYSVE